MPTYQSSLAQNLGDLPRGIKPTIGGHAAYPPNLNNAERSGYEGGWGNSCFPTGGFGGLVPQSRLKLLTD